MGAFKGVKMKFDEIALKPLDLLIQVLWDELSLKKLWVMAVVGVVGLVDCGFRGHWFEIGALGINVIIYTASERINPLNKDSIHALVWRGHWLMVGTRWFLVALAFIPEGKNFDLGTIALAAIIMLRAVYTPKEPPKRRVKKFLESLGRRPILQPF